MGTISDNIRTHEPDLARHQKNLIKIIKETSRSAENLEKSIQFLKNYKNNLVKLVLFLQ